MPVASTAFRCRDLLPRAPQQIVAAAFASRSGTLVVTKSYDDTASVTGTRGTYERLDLSHRTNRRHHGNSVISWIALGARDADFRDARKNCHSRVGLELGAAVAGAIAATALAFVLDSFGVAIGLALLQFCLPTWRDKSFALVLLSGLYLVLAALASYGLGGDIAGRMRRRYDPGESLVSRRNARPRSLGIGDFPCGPYSGNHLALIASHTRGSGSDTKCDEFGTWGKPHRLRASRLFRGSERRTGGDLTYDRAEAARILLTTSSHSGMVSAARRICVVAVEASPQGAYAAL